MAAPPQLLWILCAVTCCCCCPASSALSPAGDVHDSCPDILTLRSLRTAPPTNSTLLLVVPWRVGFDQFVKFWPGNCTITGFVMDVFRSALPYLQDPRLRSFRFVLLGDGSQTPTYDDMVQMVRNKTVDGVVGDLTITRDRSKQVGFTVAFLASYLVMITPLRYVDQPTVWDFLKPFSKQLWATLLCCFVATGVVLYFLEDKNPDFFTAPKHKEGNVQQSNHGGPSSQGQDLATSFYAPPKDPLSTIQSSEAHEDVPLRIQSVRDNYTNIVQQDVYSLQRPGPAIYDQASHTRRLLNSYWFTSLCVFQSQQESVRTHLGRIAAVLWLFAMVIFNAGYTASLASILSGPSSFPTIAGFQELLGDSSISVGCQQGSFMQSYLQKLNLGNRIIKTYTTAEQFAQALRAGYQNGVGAVLDEAPYTQQLLQTYCSLLTQSSRADDNLPAFGGLGFAFRQGDSLIDELSSILLRMGENGTLKNLQDKWQVGANAGGGCNSGPSNLGVISFGGLFAIALGVYVVCTIWRLATRQSSRSAFVQAPPCFRADCAIDLQTEDLPHGSALSEGISQENRSGFLAAGSQSPHREPH